MQNNNIKVTIHKQVGDRDYYVPINGVVVVVPKGEYDYNDYNELWLCSPMITSRYIG